MKPLLRHLWLAGLLMLGIAAQSRAQGCTQCLDTTQAASPAVQAAYRHSIYLLAGAGAAIFLGGIFLIRKER